MINKEYEKFEKKLLTILNSSSNAKIWSDLLPMTKEILNHLIKNQKEIDFSQISIKYMLSKRLAQCLNPECPNGVHEVVLDVYKILIKNIMEHQNNNLMDNLPLYTSGLFPFFPNASLPNKNKFLNEIVMDCLSNINPDELTLCFPGLLASLIPGLDDGNEATTKLIYQVFENLIKKLNNKQTFFGSYWTLLLRNKHLRCSGIKYLIENIIKYSDLRSKPKEEQEKIIDYSFPNINTTVVNAISEIIKDEDIPTVRNGMDFILTRFPLSKDNNIINDNAKINLIINALHLLIKNDTSVIRRLNNWILGIISPDDEVNYKSEDMKYKMELIVEAFKFIFNPEKNYSTEELLNNLKILEEFCENQTNLTNYILSKISYEVIKCVVNYWQMELNSSENADKNEIVIKINNFFRKKNNIEILWISLADNLKTIIEIKSKKNDNKNSKDNSYNSLLDEINNIIEKLKFCLLFLDIKKDIEKINFYLPIIMNLLNIIKNLKLENRENLKDIRHIILITLVFIKTLQDKNINNDDVFDDEESNNEGESLNEEKIIEKKMKDRIRKPSIFIQVKKGEDIMQYYNKAKTKKEKYSIDKESSLLNIIKNNPSIISSLSESVKNYQQFYINILSEFLKITNNMQITKFEISIFKQCSELVIRLQEYSQQDGKPSWISYLEKLIFYPLSNIKIVFEASNLILDLYSSSFNNSQIYQKLKTNFFSDPLNNSIINDESLKIITNKTGAKNNCYELLMGKFYLMLSEQMNQKTIIDLLIKIAQLNMGKFDEMLLRSISSDDFNLTVEGIKLFSEFWKLLNEYYRDLKFFDNGKCVFKMLDYLDNKNPLLRHLSKTWLNQVNQKFNKILDPIVCIFLSNEIDLVYKLDQIYFGKEYDTNKILEAFAKLRNIILNSSIISFLTSRKAMNNDNISINMGKIKNPNLTTLNYLGLLIMIALRFTQAKCKENMNKEFKEEIYGVNAASCEFLEFLVNITPNEKLLIKIANEINRPLLKLLDKAIEKNDEVMQVQILSVIRIIDFSSPEKYENNPDKKQIIWSLLKDDILSNILIKGMTSDYYFIRENFINFTKSCLPFFSIIITNKEEYESIFGLGINFISALTKFLSKIIYIEKIGRKDAEKFSHFDNENNNIVFKNYLEEYKEYKIYDENDVLLILKGIKDIILFFLNIDYNGQYSSNKKKRELLSKSLGPSFINRTFLRLSSTTNNSSNSKENKENKENKGSTNNNDNRKTNNKIDFDENWVEFKKDLIISNKKCNSRISYIFNISEENPERALTNWEEISIFPNNPHLNHIYNLLNGLILAWTNESDSYEVYDYCLNLNGVLAPIQINSWDNLTNVELKNSIDTIRKNPIKKVIIEIASNLFSSSPIEFIEKIVDIWYYGLKYKDSNEENVNASICKQFQLSIIELLISMKVPLNIILYCLNQILITKLKFIDKKYKSDSKTKIPITPYENSLYEAKIFHFIYSYILLNPICDPDEITEIWKEMTNIFYTIINNSKITYTFCWLYEVMQLSLDKFKINNTNNNEIFKPIADIFNIISSKLIDITFENKVESAYSTNEKLVIPILPHIYSNVIGEKYKYDNLYLKDMIGKLKKESENKEKNKIASVKTMISNDSILSGQNTINLSKVNSDILNSRNTTINSSKDLYIPPEDEGKKALNIFYKEYCKEIAKASEYNKMEDGKINVIQECEKLNTIYRRLAMITLKENYFKIFNVIYDGKAKEIKKQLIEIIKGIINLVKSKDSFLKECASEFLVSLMENIPKVTKYGKDLIMNYFNEPSFFQTDTINLHNWRKIISHYANYNPEIINDLLYNIDGKGFLLKTNDNEKIRILRRISFVIYSCQKDTFSKQFDIIQSKAKDLLSGYGTNNNTLLEGEIFLMMRILFSRFSHEGVMKMIRDLWPIIFTELIQNIENNKRNQNIDLVAESFKFIELLSLANIEEFTLYEWIFIMDTYNMSHLDTRIKDSMLNRLLPKENKAFKPLALNILSRVKLEVTDELLEGKHKGKSELYIRIKKDNFEELFKGVKKFFYSIKDMNSYKVPINYEQIENIIEDDFIEHNR